MQGPSTTRWSLVDRGEGKAPLATDPSKGKGGSVLWLAVTESLTISQVRLTPSDTFPLLISMGARWS